MLFRVIYASEASEAMRGVDLEPVLEVSAAKNSDAGITGVLIYGEGVFVQVLEGERETVLNLMGRIACDPRHRRLSVLSATDIEGRAFEQWRMALLSSDPAEMAHWAGLKGTDTADTLIEALRNSPNHVTDFLAGVIETLDDRTPA